MKTLIVNLVTNIFSEPDHNHIKDYEKIESEYLAAPFNPEVDIFIFLLFTTEQNKTDIKIRQLKKDASVFLFEDGPKLEQFDFGDADNLKKLFTTLNENEDYKNKILVTWDHGYGYLMFKNELSRTDFVLFTNASLRKFGSNLKEMITALNPVKYVTDNVFNKSYFLDNIKGLKSVELSNATDLQFENIKNHFGGFIINAELKAPEFLSDSFSSPQFDLTFPVKELTALTINELSKAIESSELNKFDLIVMSNCYMQNIDTAYALRNSCNYLIAPQTTFPWESYEFSSLIPLAGQSIDDGYCINILEKTQKSLEQKLVSFNNDVQLEEIAFSCIKTKDNKLFFDELKKITEFMPKYYISLSDDIHNAANQACDLTHIEGTNPNELRLDQIDLFFFLSCLNEKWKKYPEFSKPFQELKNIFDNNQFILKNKKGNLFLGNENAPAPKNISNGVSIFFPKNKKSYKKSKYAEVFVKPGSQIQTLFSKEYAWGTFIEQFFNLFN